MDQTDDVLSNRADEESRSNASQTSGARIELVQGRWSCIRGHGGGFKPQGKIDYEKSVWLSERRNAANGFISYAWKTTRAKNQSQILLRNRKTITGNALHEMRNHIGE